MHARLCRSAQDQAIWESPLHPNITQARTFSQLQQLTGFETTQYRQCTIVSQQSIVKNYLPERRVKQVRDRMTIEIDNKYPSPRHATHLAKYRNHLLVDKVMREERTDDVIKTIARKRNF